MLVAVSHLFRAAPEIKQEPVLFVTLLCVPLPFFAMAKAAPDEKKSPAQPWNLGLIHWEVINSHTRRERLGGKLEGVFCNNFNFRS